MDTRSLFAPLRPAARLALASALAVALLIAYGWMARPAQAQDEAPAPASAPAAALPDLVIDSVTLLPATPALSGTLVITAVVKNTGGAGISEGFYTSLYIEPAENPPVATTPHTSRMGWFMGMAAGAQFAWAYSDELAFSPGCGHVLYVWADPDNLIAESNETNNLARIEFCTAGAGDAFEPDNACAAAKGLTANAAPQAHTFTSSADEDWLRFDVVAGGEYLLEATGQGSAARPSMAIFSNCSLNASFSGTQRIPLKPAVGGTYFVRVTNDTPNGPTATEYSIQLKRAYVCAGNYEPNDTPATATEITPEAGAQNHTFCRPDDRDWVQVAAGAGLTYTVSAAPTTPGLTLVMTGYVNGARVAVGNPLLISPATTGPLLVEVGPAAPISPFARTTEVSAASNTADANDADADGADAAAPAYTLQVRGQSCSSDAFEGDNTRAAARAIAVSSGAQRHAICPAGDHDWVSFTAAAGVTYTVEALNVGALADAQFCLYDSVGTRIACGADAGYRVGAVLHYQATAPGLLYVDVSHASRQAAGSDTAYDLSIAQGLCKPDLQEPDATGGLTPLPTTGQRQLHTFCPAGDVDLTPLEIAAAGQFSIRTEPLGRAADTTMELLAPDGTSVLAANDDYGPGLGSQIVYAFAQPGRYLVRTRSFNPARLGEATAYALVAFAGTRPPPATPPGDGAAPPADSDQPPATSTLQSVIVTNYARVEAIYGAAARQALEARVLTLAAHTGVKGEVLDMGRNDSVARAYAVWTANEASVAAANQVAATIHGVLTPWLRAHASVRFIVLVGDDRVLPMRRVRDRSEYPESEYAVLGANNAMGAALAADYYLTDDYYADLTPAQVAGGDLFVPERAIGRLVESPTQIMGMIDQYLKAPSAPAPRTLVVGYDFVQDYAANACELAGRDMGSAALNCTLIGDTWSIQQFRQLMLQAQPAFNLFSINGHASHVAFGAPTGGQLSARDILSATVDLSGGLAMAVGCHSGLNAPANSGYPLDLAEAFAARRAAFVGNTGFGWGSNAGVFLSERLMQNAMEALLTGTSAEIGAALSRAKQRYVQESSDFDGLDAKVVMQAVLYGLPMQRVATGSVLSDADPSFPSVIVQSPFGGGAQAQAGEGVGRLSLSVAEANAGTAGAAGFVRHDAAWGSYYALDGHISPEINSPVQPYLYVPLTPPAGTVLHGALLVGARYHTTTAEPLIAGASNEYRPLNAEPDFAAAGFYPPVPFALHGTGFAAAPAATASTAAESAAVESTAVPAATTPMLATAMGQVDAGGGRQRLYDALDFDLYYGPLGADSVGPTIDSVDGFYNSTGDTARFKVEARDPAGVARIVIAYTAQSGTWSSMDLTYAATEAKWSGSVVGLRAAEYFVQAVDRSGNGVSVTQKNHNFVLSAAGSDANSATKVFLPTVSGQR